MTFIRVELTLEGGDIFGKPGQGKSITLETH